MEVEINSQFEQVLNFVNNTNKTVFLTGKAGTGKTTLLKHIRQNTFKQMAVVAPTGVAAINAGGSTIHSFFQFPFTPYIPSLKENGELNPAGRLPVLRYNKQRLSILRNLELLIVDEISMVRADLLDQIDITLRQTRKKWHLPFGGVQVLLIGDMYQLPPVVQQEEWSLLSKIYPTPYFFDSLVMRAQPAVYIELEKIYRQTEQDFVSLLNKVRNNLMDNDTLNQLNTYYKANITEKDYQENITLTTHNKKANEINSRNLEALRGKSQSFECKVEGNFHEKNFPAEKELILKPGARVMFLKNNSEKGYYNGKIGIVTKLEKDSVYVKCDEDGFETDVKREVWTNVSYKLDPTTKHIDEEVLGTFTQFPLRHAWAITIHKSQGLTFDKLIIDAADSFSAGQVYVALSRCRSLKGLILSSKIHAQSLLTDADIVRFASSRPDGNQLNDIYHSAKQGFILNTLTGLFDFSSILAFKSDLTGILQQYQDRFNSASEWSTLLFPKLDALAEVSRKFVLQLNELSNGVQDFESDKQLQERIQKAALYFEGEIKLILDETRKCPLVTESKEAADEFNDALKTLHDDLFAKNELIKSCKSGFVFSEYVKAKLNIKFPEIKLNVYASARNTRVSSAVEHPVLFKLLLQERDDICEEEGKPVYMVANSKALTELCNFLPHTEEDLLKISGFGKARTEAYGQRFLKIIRSYTEKNGLSVRMNLLPSKKTKKSVTDVERKHKRPTAEITFELFQNGKTVQEVAAERNLTVGTIVNHLVPYLKEGKIAISDLVPSEKQKRIEEALESLEGATGLNAIKSRLPDDISYNEIRLVLAIKQSDFP